MALKPRNIGFAALAALVVGGLLFVALRTEPVPVDLHTVERGPMQITINADGKTRIRQIYDVAAPITGTARRAPVEVGDPVTQGETVVAVVEPAAPGLLDERTRIQAQAAVSEAEAALHVAESQVRKAEEDLAYAQSQFDRAQSLVERGVASLTRLEDAAQVLAVSRAAQDAAISGLDMATGSLDRARAALIEPTSDAAGTGGSCCVQIRAPITGQVLAVDIVSERPVLAGTRLVSIGQTDDLEIVADLLSSDAVRLSPGARAYVERWGGPVPLEAELRSVDPAARTKVSALGIEEQRVDVDFDLLSPPEARQGLGDQFSVFLRIVEWEADDVIQVPLSAIFRNGDTWSAFVADQGQARLTAIRIGRKNGTMAQVLDGIEPGMQVIMHPSDDIESGVPIVERAELK